MKIVLGIIVLGWFCVMIGYIIKNMVEEVRQLREQDKQYKMALSYIKRHHKHGGVIPTPADMWLHGRIRKTIAIKAYEAYMEGVER